jgi:hypothetical protein
MFRNKSVNVHKFAMIPRADIPRSSFRRQHAHKTTFDAGLLIPIYVDEVLPGDTFNLKLTSFARMSTPIFPLMDNLHMETFFFFVPNRLVWDNFQRFMGEQRDPGDSTDYVIPQHVSPAGGYAPCSLQDYMGLPTAGQIPAGNTYSHSALWPRAYNLIYNEWFRDENLIDSAVVNRNDGPDNVADYVLRRRGKRHDYFTSALPWPSKGAEVGFGLIGTQAPVLGIPNTVPVSTLRGGFQQQINTSGTIANTNINVGASSPYNLYTSTTPVGGLTVPVYTAPGSGIADLTSLRGALYADLSVSTALTINQLRTSFQVQKLLERDARGGTRYTEILRSHFGVTSPDARLQRPEYLGGGSTPIHISPIAQTSATGVSGGTSPQGNLAAMGTAVSRTHGFSQSFVEHGLIIGLVCVRADLTYQQGLHRMWSRRTRYDFYFPAFAALGEQAILNKEIYLQGTSVDNQVFGYQERWAEYRYKPSQISGMFKSTTAGTLDSWHMAQRFGSLPTLNKTFIEENPPIARVVAAGSLANNQQFIYDSFFDIHSARPMPLYSVPGLIDHF